MPELLPWDTDFFGARIGRSIAEEPSAAAEWARAEGVECLYVFEPLSDLERIRTALALGARLVDVRMTLAREEMPVEAAHARTATGDDLPRLLPLAEALAAESRFAADPRFTFERVREMYRVWIRHCLEEGLVAVDDDVTALVAARRQRIELVYVDPDARGQGTGRALLAHALAQSTGTVTVATQTGNVAAQRLYQSLGFRTRDVTAIMHLWLR